MARMILTSLYVDPLQWELFKKKYGRKTSERVRELIAEDLVSQI